MRIIERIGEGEPATVYVGELDDGSCIEMVESIQPPISRREKWVFVISTLKGCPVGCPICDAGWGYRGKLTRAELLAQIRFLISTRFPDLRGETGRLKIQFARMGEPAFNSAVLELLETLKRDIGFDAVQPSISTVAPCGRDLFFEKLIVTKNRLYRDGWFQMQFSLHTTSPERRRTLIPVRTWSMAQMSAFGERYFEPGDLKISLNFAAVKGAPLDPERVAEVFSPEKFLVKLTPVNPTRSSIDAGIGGIIDPDNPDDGVRLVEQFQRYGFETILSIGDLAENRIGSNCGMYVSGVSERSPRNEENHTPRMESLRKNVPGRAINEMHGEE